MVFGRTVSFSRNLSGPAAADRSDLLLCSDTCNVPQTTCAGEDQASGLASQRVLVSNDLLMAIIAY